MFPGMSDCYLSEPSTRSKNNTFCGVNDNVYIPFDYLRYCSLCRSCWKFKKSLLCQWIPTDAVQLENERLFYCKGSVRFTCSTLLDKVMSRNQWHTGVQERHLMVKDSMQLNYNVLFFKHFYAMSVCIMTRTYHVKKFSWTILLAMIADSSVQSSTRTLSTMLFCS